MYAPLRINYQPIPGLATFALSQSYAPLNPGTILRLADGAAVRQVTWQKLATRIEAAGSLPPALSAVDFAQPVIIDCVAARSLFSETPTITVPGHARPDVPPCARAVLPDGSSLPTGYVLTSGVATLHPVPGAVGYELQYWPRLVCVSAGVEERTDPIEATVSWSLFAEEA